MMLWPCESQTAMPSIRPAAPIVMTIGFARQAPTAKPWTAPIASPSSSVSRIATRRSNRSAYRKTIAEIAAVWPSASENRLPLRTMTVRPTAMIPTNAAAVRIAFRLLTVRNPVVVTAP